MEFIHLSQIQSLFLFLPWRGIKVKQKSAEKHAHFNDDNLLSTLLSADTDMTGTSFPC